MTNEELALKMLGMDRTKEILNLWREVSRLRNILKNVIRFTPDVNSSLFQEWLLEADNESRIFVTNRFPLLNTTFEENPERSNPDNEMEDS